jgi:hypothetical protein
MTDKKTDEPAVVQVIAGPYAGQRLTMPKADADAAVAEKWAIDPSAPPPKEEEEKEAKPMTQEERAEIKAIAEKAAPNCAANRADAKTAASAGPVTAPAPTPSYRIGGRSSAACAAARPARNRCRENITRFLSHPDDGSRPRLPPEWGACESRR